MASYSQKHGFAAENPARLFWEPAGRPRNARKRTLPMLADRAAIRATDCWGIIALFDDEHLPLS
jgi:hypothetical protein